MDSACFSPGTTSLPQEVLSVLPADPQAQLELSYRITCFAHAQRVVRLETESKQLRDVLLQKENEIVQCRQRAANAEREVHGFKEKSKKDQEENHRLRAEKSALIDTVKRLNREVAKLEGFKKNLLQTLTEDDERTTEPGGGFSQTSIDATEDRLVSNILASAQQHPTHTFNHQAQHAPSNPASKWLGGHVPPSVPTTSRDAASGAGLFSAGSCVSRIATPPLSNEPQSPATFCPPSVSGLSSVSSRIDGKEFFRQARAHLSYEQFSQFLQNIKELNHGRQSRDETLRKARDIFGMSNMDLYSSFEALLNRHLPTL